MCWTADGEELVVDVEKCELEALCARDVAVQFGEVMRIAPNGEDAKVRLITKWWVIEVMFDGEKWVETRRWKNTDAWKEIRECAFWQDMNVAFLGFR